MTERRRAELISLLSTIHRTLALAQVRTKPPLVESPVLCFFVRDEPPRDQWRFSATTQPVMRHAKYVSRTVKVKVYAVHTIYGRLDVVKLLEAYLCRYDLGDGWYGPITEETMRRVFLQLKNEGPVFLETTPLE